jgi:hypothetical protein
MVTPDMGKASLPIDLVGMGMISAVTGVTHAPWAVMIGPAGNSTAPETTCTVMCPRPTTDRYDDDGIHPG